MRSGVPPYLWVREWEQVSTIRKGVAGGQRAFWARPSLSIAVHERKRDVEENLFLWLQTFHKTKI